VIKLAQRVYLNSYSVTKVGAANYNKWLLRSIFLLV